MKKLFSILMPLLLIAALTAATGSVQAKQGGKRGPGGEIGIPHGNWWTRANVQEKLKLSDKQIKQLETIGRDGRKQMVKLHAELELLNIDLEPIIGAKTFDRKAAEAVIDKMEGVRAKMAKQRITMLLDMREVLSQSQYLKLKEIKGSGRRGKKHTRAQGPRMGQGGRQ